MLISKKGKAKFFNAFFRFIELMATISGSFVRTLFQIHVKSDTFAECLICSKKIKRGRELEEEKAYGTAPLHNHLKKNNTMTSIKKPGKHLKKHRMHQKVVQSSLLS